MENKEKAKTVAMEQPPKKRPMNEGEWYSVGHFKLKKVRLIVDDQNHSRELLPSAKMTQKFLEKNKSFLINAVKISDHEEFWQLRIPSTFDAYSIITSLYESGDQQSDDILQTLLCNFANATTVMDGLFHNLLLNVGSIYVTRTNNNLTKKEKKREYFEVLKLAMKNILSDLEFSEEDMKRMEKANEEFDKMLLENSIQKEMQGEKGN